MDYEPLIESWLLRKKAEARILAREIGEMLGIIPTYETGEPNWGEIGIEVEYGSQDR